MRTTCCSDERRCGLAGRLRSRRSCATRASGATPIWCGCAARSKRSAIPLPPEHFSDADWASLLDGYFAAAVRRLGLPRRSDRTRASSLHAAAVSGAAVRQCWRVRCAPACAARLLARLARRASASARCARGGGIWVHAVSVGEVQVAAILIAALREREPQLRNHAHLRHADGRARGRGHCCPDSTCATHPTICRAACGVAWRGCGRAC